MRFATRRKYGKYIYNKMKTFKVFPPHLTVCVVWVSLYLRVNPVAIVFCVHTGIVFTLVVSKCKYLMECSFCRKVFYKANTIGVECNTRRCFNCNRIAIQ